MTALDAALAIAAPKNQEAKDADAAAQAARQTVDTKDTALNLITYARDQLLLTNDGNEGALTGYGFTRGGWLGEVASGQTGGQVNYSVASARVPAGQPVGNPAVTGHRNLRRASCNWVRLWPD